MEFYHRRTELHYITFPCVERYNIPSCPGKTFSNVLTLFFFFFRTIFFPGLSSNPLVEVIFIFLNHLKIRFYYFFSFPHLIATEVTLCPTLPPPKEDHI